MKHLAIDLETYSSVDLVKAGAYKYASAPDFEILLFAYAYDESEVQVIDLASGEPLPDAIIQDIKDPRVIKTAYNANFERICLSRHLGRTLSPAGWQCTAVQAAMLGLPRSLAGVAAVLGLEQQKMKEGKDLIRYFCIPCKPTQTNQQRTRNTPSHAPEKWQTFKRYCRQDVAVEQAVRRKLAAYPIRESEQQLYELDQQINDRGVRIDPLLTKKALACDAAHSEEAMARAQQLTGLQNPNSVAQLKSWLLSQGMEVDTLSKKTVATLVKEAEGDVATLLRLRMQLAKTSIKKYEAIQRAVCPDGRVRGMLQFYGANRTGRWSGKIVQLQNLPQNHLLDLTLARELVKAGCIEELELLFDSVPQVLSELIRTAFVPKPGYRFLVADFSAIEARVIAWLAGEAWRMEVFQSHGKIYEASASQMFKVPIETITKGSPLRQKGKIAELALGYGGSVGALTAMGALDMGLTEKELPALVNAWRDANPNITRLWWNVDRAAQKAVKEKTSQSVGRITLRCQSGILFITLPSGRTLAYIKPKIGINKFGREGITYEGIDSGKHWARIDTYGPKLVENIVQATARDLLAEAMLAADAAGYEIVMHCHDELIVEAPLGHGSLTALCNLMGVAPAWAKGLPLRADGYECDYYRKD